MKLFNFKRLNSNFFLNFDFQVLHEDSGIVLDTSRALQVSGNVVYLCSSLVEIHNIEILKLPFDYQSNSRILYLTTQISDC